MQQSAIGLGNLKKTKAIQYLTTFVIILFILSAVATVTAGGANKAGGVVKNSDVNVRAEANTGSSVLGVLQKGENVVIVKWANDSWYEVLISGGTRGFILAKYVAPVDSVTFAVGTGELVGEDVAFRAGPTTDSNRYALLKLGAQFEVIGSYTEWYKVKYSGKEGYVHSDFVRIIKTSAAAKVSEAVAAPKAADVKDLTASYTDSAKAVKYSSDSDIAAVEELAISLLGTKYTWAGANPSTGFDCSGFTYYLANSIGVELPHGASGQYKYGNSVEKADLIPGDYVFFSSDNTTGIAHVGMYLGDGVFIHASSGGKEVKLNNLSDSYYNQKYYGARRIL
ncbi:MAG: C40 family peptidase [Oscillospiraceae bacterium]|jgi:cell wall-associated NlpC family hydrolase|nr:C40 family peptidase [Oscillospiraceae bacterium]